VKERKEKGEKCELERVLRRGVDEGEGEREKRCGRARACVRARAHACTCVEVGAGGGGAVFRRVSNEGYLCLHNFKLQRVCNTGGGTSVSSLLKPYPQKYQHNDGVNFRRHPCS
jgi:hypothetical protein